MITDRKLLAALCVFVAGFLVACDQEEPPPSDEPPPSESGTVPLPDMGPRTNYFGFEGQLYPGTNTIPSSHLARQPSVANCPVMIVISMSNGMREFGRFQQIARTCATLINTAQGGQGAKEWSSARSPVWDVADQRVRDAGFTPADVRVAWMKQASRSPHSPLPATNADAFRLLAHYGNILRVAKVRYPNLEQVYVSSRTWSCATFGVLGDGKLNPEPFAYESGFAVKWLIEAQINQLAGSGVHPQAGNLALGAVPWLAWGPYLWDPTVPRRFLSEKDCTHPSTEGAVRVAELLVDFFETSGLTEWYLESIDTNTEPPKLEHDLD